MTSSFMLDSIYKKPGTWKYRLPNSPLGGMEDSYIKLQGNCHPDFATMPIGNPEGVKMCIRKPGGCGDTTRIGHSLHVEAEKLKEQSQGYNRASPRMYDVKSNTPIQEWNPQYYADRRTPWEQDLLRRDYQRWGMKYSGTGIKVLRTPSQLRDEGKPYFEYGYSYTPVEDRDTGMRVGAKVSDSVPEYKYDVTRLHQPYPIWKNEQEWIGANPERINSYDKTFYKRVV